MRFKTLSLLGTAALLSAPLTTARAQYNIGNPTDVCGGNLFTFCVAISAAQGTGAESANFFVTIINKAFHGSNAGAYADLVITSLGFNGYATAPIIFAASVGTDFDSSNDINDLSNFPGNWVGAEATSPSPKNGLLFNEFITFKFAGENASTFNTSSLAMHAQAGPRDCSAKFAFSLSGGSPVNAADITTGCAAGVVTATPEPASIVLMATGLFGVLGVSLRRRQG